jgi:type III pantothenate kinase
MKYLLSPPSKWLALTIGNSRLHWGFFEQNQLIKRWHTPHLTTVYNPTHQDSDLPIYIASVVPSQTHLFKNYPYLVQITLNDIPLQKLYPTLGIDRALAAWGAGEIYGFPCLVIDAGTALTLTGINESRELIGGAILPGFQLQFQSLFNKTAALPDVTLPEKLSSPWANTTQNAIESGVIYTTLAGVNYFISDWRIRFSNTSILLTGGDSSYLFKYIQKLFPDLGESILVDADLIFWGMRSLVFSHL